MILLMPIASLYPLMVLKYFQGSVAQAGLIEIIYSVGMLLGGIIISVFGNWKNRMIPVFLSYIISGITFGFSGILPASSQGFIWFIALNFFGGLAAPFLQTLLMAMVQESYPAEHLGRVLGVLNSMLNITGPIGLIFAGPIADAIGVEKMFIIAGIGIFACGILNFIIPSARNYDKTLRARKKIKVI